MAKESTMLALGTTAPDFRLPDADGKLHNLAEFKPANGLVVAFISSHCPYVKHVRTEFARFASEYQAKGVKVVAIMSNDLQISPQDGPSGMKADVVALGYTFPFLLDESQSIARAYQAACTPDFFLFDSNQTLVYRGQFDSTRPNSGVPATGADLRAAVEVLLAGKPPLAEQIPSVGCGIKWRAGNEPVYA